MNTATSCTYTTIPTRNQILERLLKAGHITFDEMIVLLEKEYIYNTIPQPIVHPQPWDWDKPIYIPTTQFKHDKCNNTSQQT